LKEEFSCARKVSEHLLTTSVGEGVMSLVVCMILSDSTQYISL